MNVEFLRGVMVLATMYALLTLATVAASLV